MGLVEWVIEGEGLDGRWSETKGRAGTYAVFVFDQTLVVSADGYQEKETVDILETVNPLLSLRPLSTHIKHAISQRAEIEYGFCNTSRP